MFLKQLSNYREKVGAAHPYQAFNPSLLRLARGGLIVYTHINEEAEVRLIKS